MRTIRAFLDQALAPHSRVRVEGSAANHLLRVLRLGAGEALVVFDGRGGEFCARIGDAHKSTLTVEIGEHRCIERESPLDVTLAQGLARGERMDVVVQKATELGVRRMIPVITERTVVRYGEAQRAARLRHWRGIAVAACEQCGRNTLPEIAEPVTLAQFLATRNTADARLVLSPTSPVKMLEVQRAARELKLLVGPEGGLTEQEERAAIDAGWCALGLGPRVLRTETAAIAAVTAAQLLYGDL